MEKKNRNKLGLKILLSNGSFPEDNYSPDRSQLWEKLYNEQLVMNEKQIAKLEDFGRNRKRLTASELKNESFQVICELGSGSGGVVKKVRHISTDLIIARKIIHLEIKQEIRRNIMRELKTLQECKSPYIVGFYGAFFQGNEISILMEYMDVGSLDFVYKKVGKIPEPILTHVSLCVLRGLIYLREKHKIIHRDVKPSNMLISSQGSVKICDFGVSGELIESIANSFVGTSSYMSPERLQGHDYSTQSDVWSLGISLLEMFLGYFPIPPRESPFSSSSSSSISSSSSKQKDISIFELLEYIVNEDPPQLPSHLNFSPEFSDFVSQCLLKNPELRPTAIKLLHHPFILSSTVEISHVASWLSLSGLSSL